METRKEHPDTLPQFSPPLKNIPLGQATLPYEPFAPPPAQLNSRYLTALQALAPIAKQVIKKAVETPRLEDGQLDIESSAAESWDEFGRILLHTKDGFYPLHKLDRAQYVLPIPSAALSEERYTTARQVNVALLLALLYPSETTQLNSYMQWITFLSQLKETYLLLCADRDKKDLLWVSLERISEICVALCLALESLDKKSTGLLAYRFVFSHSHLRHSQLTEGTKKVIEPNDLARFESVWSHQAQQEIRKLCSNPMKLDDAISVMRNGLLKDILEGIIPVVGDYAPTTATPFPSPMKLAVPSPVMPKMVRPGFAWNVPQTDAIRLTESSSFVEVEEEEPEDESPVKTRGRKGKQTYKGKGKARAKRTNGNRRTRSATGTDTDTDTEREEEMIVAAAVIPTVPTILEDSENETLPEVDEVILETQLFRPPIPTPAPAPTAPPAYEPAQTATPKGKKRAREESTTPTPRAAKRQARSVPVKPVPAPSTRAKLPTPQQFFDDTQEPTPASVQPKPPAEKRSADDTREQDQDAEVVIDDDDDDEVPEEEVEQEEDEVDQLRSSVPVPTPEKPSRPVAGPSKSSRLSKPPVAPTTPPPKKEKKPKRDVSSSPVKSAISKKNRYATGGNETGRRAWTTVEDNALMSALQEIHKEGLQVMKWKTVLMWHGREGTESTILKDRNNAQLKDRARNLYLKYQRNGQDPPEWLPDK